MLEVPPSIRAVSTQNTSAGEIAGRGLAMMLNPHQSPRLRPAATTPPTTNGERTARRRPVLSSLRLHEVAAAGLVDQLRRELERPLLIFAQGNHDAQDVTRVHRL